MDTYPVSTQQLLLLKASVLPVDEALLCWQAWLTDQALDYLKTTNRDVLAHVMAAADEDSKRLMPLIYRNLEPTSDPIIPYLREVYRYTWMKNQKHLQKLQKVVDALQLAGIEILLIKGLPLSIRYYGDLGVRLSNDLDLLIPTDCADRALEILRNPPYNLRVLKHEMKYRSLLHAMHLVDEDGWDIDLHWNLLIHHPYPGADEPFWAQRQPLTLPDGSVKYTISPTHQLFHNIVHGYAYHWRVTQVIRWIPDSYVILKDQKAVNWQELFELSAYYRMSIPVQQGLCLLMAEFGLNLPDDVRHQIDNLAITEAEKTYFALIHKQSSNPFMQGVRYLKRERIAYGLFRRLKSGLSLRQYIQKEIGRSIELRNNPRIYAEFL